LCVAVKQFLAQKLITKMEHPFFWLFPKIKPALKGQRFQGTEDIKKKKKVTTALKAIL
jgi:hypothetical protein